MGVLPTFPTIRPSVEAMLSTSLPRKFVKVEPHSVAPELKSPATTNAVFYLSKFFLEFRSIVSKDEVTADDSYTVAGYSHKTLSRPAIID